MITQMIDETRTEKVKRAAALFSHATHAIAFSGAGISTESGIPDFRSPDSGLWTNVDPLEVASIYGFKKNPQAFYDWVRPLTETTLNAQPNPAHDALVELESIGNLRGIITQNIDALHNRAGSKVVHELHGHMRQATCIHCFEKFEADSIMKQFMVDGKAPTCPTCQGPIKPDVILFGEQLPVRVFNAAQEATRRCDLMIVIGSSLEVAPASDIPVLAKRTGAKLIIVNLEPTPADRLADVVIHDRAAVILPKIVHQLERSS